jgi:ribonuclease PH
MNVVMTGAGHFVEVQGTAEGVAFSRREMDALLALAEQGIGRAGAAAAGAGARDLVLSAQTGMSGVP